jgi:23S rRNA pseudouridine1911/1915/1917 synthase
MKKLSRKGPDILFEDNHVIAVDKPPGLLTQGDITGASALIDILKRYIKNKYKKPGNVFLGLVHRIDKPVSGIVIFAKTSKSASRLSEEFRSRKVKKFYIAAVNASFPAERSSSGGTWIRLINNLTRIHDKTVVSGDRTESDPTDPPDGGKSSQNAVLEYMPVLSCAENSLLLIRLHTGRKHQIRAQLSEAGMPVIGDQKYGSPVRLHDGSICLHSCFIRFTHPTLKASVDIFCDIPERMMKYVNGDINLLEIIKKLLS